VLSPELVFSGVATLAACLAVWAWTVPGAPPEESEGLRAVWRALRRRPVIVGFWLFTLPAIFGGVLEVLAPLRLDELGASGAAIGAAFLVAAAVEAVLSPWSGRLSDRHGRLAPIRLGLAGAVVMTALLPLPETVVLMGLALVVAVAALGAFWAPAMALLSDASEAAGLDQALAFGLANLAWASGHMSGSAGGAALADATTDAVPYALLGVACALTLGALAHARLRAPATG
jgi:predicted MFS family arabinose efflux permease